MDENFRYKTLQSNLSSIARQIAQHRLIVYPDFKDRKRWSLERKSRYVESIILGIPSQPIWCEETAIGSHLVIDGSRRIDALNSFLNNELRLSGLRIRKQYNGCTLHELPFHELVNIEDRYLIPFIVINFDTQPELKCEFYSRTFESERRYKSQAARNFGYRDSLIFLKILQEFSTSYVNFSSQNYKKHGTESSESKIDEIFLYLILFVSLNNYSSYVPSDFTVEDLLDSLMQSLSLNSDESKSWGDMVVHRLREMREENGVIEVGLVETLKPDANRLRLSEFYRLFLRRSYSRSFMADSFERTIHPTSSALRLVEAIKK